MGTLSCTNEGTGNRALSAHYKKVSRLVAALKECSMKCDLQGGRALHMSAVEAGFEANKYVANALIKMYTKCKSIVHARSVFEKVTHRDVVMWTSLILGYVENKESLIAIELLKSMDCEPDSFIFVAALKACTALVSDRQWDKQLCLETGMALHSQAKKRGFTENVYMETNLVNMYSRCGSIEDAHAVFDRVLHRDTVFWNILIMGYVENGQSLLALNLFTSINCELSSSSLVAALKACTVLASECQCERELCLEKGMAIHRKAKEYGFGTDLMVANSLVDMYSTCMSMPDAHGVFDSMVYKDVVSWNILILGYVENGESSVALELFDSMDTEPSVITFVAALKACTQLATEKQFDRHLYLEKGMAIHRRAKQCGLDAQVGSNLVEMYVKCGVLHDARILFDAMTRRNVIVWTSLVLGYVENGESLVAIDLFMRMECEPDSFTFVALLKACSLETSLVLAQSVHARICKLGLVHEQAVATALVDCYGKCGRAAAAEHVFSSVQLTNTICWNALMAGYSLLGDTLRVFNLAQEMQECGSEMDSVTFLLILKACSHAGIMKEGKKHFESMAKHGIMPTMEHYNCMADMLCKANRLQEALSLVRSMPFVANDVTWRSLLVACVRVCDFEVGKVAFDALLACNQENPAAVAYVMMGDIYKKLGMR